jgi:mRNA-degrading endonuclease RelE of RelBE toxin-antitoxin system
MYELVFLTSAKKEFKKLDTSVQKIIKKKLIQLIEDPERLKNNI